MKVFRTLGIVLLALLICSGSRSLRNLLARTVGRRFSATPQSGIGHTLPADRWLCSGHQLRVHCDGKTGIAWYLQHGSYINGNLEERGNIARRLQSVVLRFGRAAERQT